jgi:glycosyltransferase involved in cell wall biosynthesis
MTAATAVAAAPGRACAAAITWAGMESPPRVALAHDYLLVMRGAERTFHAMAECWPDAPIYTLLFDEEGTRGRFAGRTIYTSRLQALGVSQRGFRRLLPILPYAAERLDLTRHDVVISSSSAFAHGFKVAQSAAHICYCHTPFRYSWYEQERALAEVPAPLRPALRWQLQRLRDWDVRASRRVTHYIANAQITQERIARFFGRESEIVHPPVEVDRFSVGAPEDFLLVVCELVRHKRVDTALEAAKRAGRRTIVVGDGPDGPRLRQLYASSAEFVGRAPDDELADLYRRSLALVIPNVEEFGITSVEAQASGRPVVALNAGGARETVIDGETGVLVDGDGPDALAEALRHTDFERFDPRRARENAERFSVSAFQEKLRDAVDRALGYVPSARA